MVDERIEEGSSGARGLGSRSEVETFLSRLEDQLAIYDRLRKLVDRQRELIAGDDPAPLLALLGERQGVTHELAESMDKIGPIQGRWEALRAFMTESERERTREIFARMRSELGDIVASDGEDTKRLEVRKRGVGEALRGLAPRGAMLSAYGQSRATTTGALNRMDENE